MPQSAAVKTLIFISLQAVVLFVLDVVTPLGTPVWILYLIPLGFTLWLPQRHAPFLGAATLSAFMVAGYLISSRESTPSAALLNHAFGFGTLWGMAMLLYQYTRTVDRELRSEIDKRQEVAHQIQALEQSLSESVQDALSSERHKARRVQDRHLLQRSRDLELACQISEALVQRMPGNLLVEQGLRTAVAAVNAEAGTVFLFNPRSKRLVFSAVIGEKAELLVDRELPPGGSIAEAVLASGKPELIANVQVDRRHNRTVDMGTGFESRSMIVLPLKLSSEEPIGVLEIINKRTGTFNEGDLQLLAAFCTLFTAAIELTRLYREHIGRVDQLAQ